MKFCSSHDVDFIFSSSYITVKLFYQTSPTCSDMLPKPDGSVNNLLYKFPFEFSVFPYLSLLPPDKLRIDRTLKDNRICPIDLSQTMIATSPYLLSFVVGPRDRHWSIRWHSMSRNGGQDGKRATTLRCLELLEDLAGIFGVANFLINYGPLTNSSSPPQAWCF